jgi:hypothetical protein
MDLPKADASNRVGFSKKALVVSAARAFNFQHLGLYLSGHVEVKYYLLDFSCALKYSRVHEKGR